MMMMYQVTHDIIKISDCIACVGLKPRLIFIACYTGLKRQALYHYVKAVCTL